MTHAYKRHCYLCGERDGNKINDTHDMDFIIIIITNVGVVCGVGFIFIFYFPLLLLFYL